MKANALFLAAALAVAPDSTGGQGAQRVTDAELPPAVQRALTESSKGEPVKTINRRVIDGRTVYDVELERKNAINPRFRITEDGLVLAGTGVPPSVERAPIIESYDGIGIPPSGFDPMIPVETLPAAVRETIKRAAAGRQIADIDREIWQGRTVYEVEFKAAGRNPQIHIAEDGTTVRAEEPRGGEFGASVRRLFMGTQLEDTPPAVQATIRREARDHAISDIDIERRGGERIYEVKLGDGRTTHELHVAEDGRILHDTRPGDPPAKRG